MWTPRWIHTQLLLWTCLGVLISTTARSLRPGRVAYVSDVDAPRIGTPSGRVQSQTSFDLFFTLHNRDQDVKLTLEPNNDLIGNGVRVEYLDGAGGVERTAHIEPHHHKVYKGRTWLRDDDGWYWAGWARIVVLRDGENPLFEGTFSIFQDSHHVKQRKEFLKETDYHHPELVIKGKGSDLIVFRDSDVDSGPGFHIQGLVQRDLAGGVGNVTCPADRMSFNTQPDHAVNRMIMGSDTVGSSLFGGFRPIGRNGLTKRQLDGTDGIWRGIGNSAGVNLRGSIGSTDGCPTTRRVALVGVATDCTYTNDFDSEDAVRQNIIRVLNDASDLFERTFNVTLGLARLSISPKDCPTTAPESAKWNLPCSNGAQIDDRLSLFSEWRGKRTDNEPIALWTLMTTCETGSSVGLAWLGQLCQNTATQNSDDGSFVTGANVVSKTNMEWKVLAHEIGHTFGAVHDCTAEACSGDTATASMCCPRSAGTCDAGGQFIMNPSTRPGIEQFSPCTIGNICSAFRRRSVDSSCLQSNRNVTTMQNQECGNGIVEQGEECDCGGEESCASNPCCDPRTCRFKSGAVCDDSNDNCCRNCQFSPSTTVCRASNGECDPEERCTGRSAACPDDIVSTDGTGCGDGLHCASGQCTSRDQQCQVMFNNNGLNSTSTRTRACDDSSCVISCLSDRLSGGMEVCTIMRQNFLDGTPCSGDGKCKNGRCSGSSTLGRIKAWINSNKNIVIGVSCGVGGLLLLMIICCCCSCFRRRKSRRPKKAVGGNRNSRWRNIPSRQDGYGSGPGFYPSPPQMAHHREFPSGPQRAGTVRYA